ncbi:2OG-Fe(II) oxygenase [Hymenobacter caeli]|uniref:2-oxoglutarate/Fe(II)-dependent dioxygenase YbiX n=1 Tax=Hymenobacter caeli TaxID=2735894 RepID=A0ABX2FV06_9BACT|nr:2OG-Fe(II) oxygenase [Hymenobacter caeli]NRT21025.1 putative 2-oxoglutarate/Fe(II)-dependent dioxygenase YbiX [Hymenobacter caeli]
MKYTQLTDSIFTVDDFLTRQECLENIVLSEKIGYELAKVNTAAGSRVRTDVRNNNRAFHRSGELAEALWEKAAPFVPTRLGNSQALGLNELFRFYRYQRGHRFKGHFDESYIRNEHEASYFTFMVYLNDNFQGGDTAFRGLRIRPRQGTALVFLHSLYHEGSEVTQGVKYVLRSDVMFRTRVPI